MTITRQQSSINACRDQLFLDSATGVHLNTVTANYGLDRPVVGIDDDHWRYLAKLVMFRPKQIIGIFRDILTATFGPQYTRRDCLSTAAAVGDNFLYLNNKTNITQVGTLVLDPGLATEETVNFVYRDLSTGRVILSSACTQAHSVVDYASTTLAATANIGATALTSVDSTTLPDTGYPYPIILDRGTEAEELLLVSNNTRSTGVLTLASATTKKHYGPRSTFVQKLLNVAAPAGHTYIVLDVADTRVFPATGFVRLNAGGVTAETKQYSLNSVADSTIYLTRPLAHDHVASESVELVYAGSAIETCSVVQNGTGWDVFETEPRKIKIYVPETLRVFKIRDASWIHGATPSTASTTLAANLSIGDTVMHLTSSSGFPSPTGVIYVDSTTYMAYSGVDGNDLTLPYPAETGFSSGDSVSVVQCNYAGTLLEEGNIYEAYPPGGLNDLPEFPGPYLFDITQQAPSSVSTTLTTALPSPLTTAVSQRVGFTSLEINGALDWPATPTFDARIGRDTGFQEDRHCSARILKRDASTTVATGALAGVSSLDAVDSTDFPVSDGTNPAGYRLLVGSGTANEEIVTVSQNASNVFSLYAVTSNPHSIGETIELLNDVLVFDSLQQNHAEGHTVEPLITELDVASVTDLENSGTVLINYGRSITNVRKKITSVVSSSILAFDDTSDLPGTGSYNYPILVGEGKPDAELGYVSNNNTTLNRLTFASPLVGSFSTGDNVMFTTGNTESVEYYDIDTLSLQISPAIVLSKHIKGETITVTNQISEPAQDGSSFALHLPPAAITQGLFYLFDLIRAAGVEVVILTSR